MASERRFWEKTLTITRPANTTQYADGDGVSDDATTPTMLTMNGVAPTCKMGGKITSIYVHKTDQDTVGASFDLYFFDTTIVPAGFNDNAAIAITDAEWQTGVGFAEILAANWRNVVTGDVYNRTNLDISYQCVGDSTSLYAVLVARGTYTPASGEVFTIRVAGEVN